MGVQKKQPPAPRKPRKPRKTEIPKVNRKLTADRGQKVWPEGVERTFEDIYALFKLLESQPSTGKGRLLQNWWIASELFRRTGLRRTARQVSSHLQQRRKWFKRLNGEDANWDAFVVSRGILDDGLLDSESAADSADESPATPCSGSEDVITLAESEAASKVVADAESPEAVSHDIELPASPALSPAECMSAAPTPITTPASYLASPSPSICAAHIPAPAEHHFASPGISVVAAEAPSPLPTQVSFLASPPSSICAAPISAPAEHYFASPGRRTVPVTAPTAFPTPDSFLASPSPGISASRVPTRGLAEHSYASPGLYSASAPLVSDYSPAEHLASAPTFPPPSYGFAPVGQPSATPSSGLDAPSFLPEYSAPAPTFGLKPASSQALEYAALLDRLFTPPPALAAGNACDVGAFDQSARYEHDRMDTDAALALDPCSASPKGEWEGWAFDEFGNLYLNGVLLTTS